MPKGHVKTKLGVKRLAEEPNMSDTTLLVTVEELINRAMGPPDKNIVDFKLVQLILEILARQQRILLQKIEIRITDVKDETRVKTAPDDSSMISVAKSPPRVKSKSLKRQKRKSTEKAFKEDRCAENIGQQVNIPTDEKEKSKEIIEQNKVDEDEEVQEEEEETKETIMQDEFQEIAQEILLGKEHEGEDEYDTTEVLLTKENEQLYKKEHHEKLQIVSHKVKTENQTHEKERKVSQKGSEKINIEINEKKEHIPASAKEKVVPKKRSDTSRIEITEKQIDTEKILVIEKGPSTRSETQSSSAIDFVTMSQFAFLEAAVEELRSIAPPMPIQLPENEKLMSDMMKGTVSLPEAMETLQVKEKIKAAERSMTRITEILTQLVAAGALPEDIAVQVETIIPPSYEEVNEETVESQPAVAKKSVAIDPKATHSQATQSQESKSQPTQSQATQSQAPQSQADQSPAARVQALKPSVISEPSLTSSVISRHSTDSRSFADSISTRVPCVTHKDMRAYLKDLKDDITKIINRMMGKIIEMAENAKHINNTVAAKVDVVQKLNSRITALNALLEDYANQFSVFDSLLSIQLPNIEGQINEMHHFLKSGLAQLTDANNTAEAAAIMNLLERSEELENTASAILYEIKGLMITQIENQAQMQILKDCTKMMQEEKANRDEVLERLKDKTDFSSLAGRLSYEDFAATIVDIERRLDHCHEIFHRSIALWAAVIKDLKNQKEKKADLLELLTARESVQDHLQALNNKIRIVAAVLGDPQVALNMRKTVVDATCGSCHEPAKMEPIDACSGVPPRLPALRQTPVAMSTEPCVSEWIRARSPELQLCYCKLHVLQNQHRSDFQSVKPDKVVQQHIICDRWCGGSHTLVTDPTKRFQLHVQMQAIPTKHFTDYGDDGRLYMCEEALQPCIECNSLSGEKTQDSAYIYQSTRNSTVKLPRACIKEIMFLRLNHYKFFQMPL